MQDAQDLEEKLRPQNNARVLSILLAAIMLFDLVDPAMFIFEVPSSLIFRVASLTHHAWWFGVLFLLLATLLLPYLAMQLFCPQHPAQRQVTQLACFALLASGVTWMYLAWLARDLDMAMVAGVFLRTGLGAFGFSFALGLSLNHELARKLARKLEPA